MSKIGIIGGSGLYEIEGLVLKKARALSTPFGSPSDKYMLGEINGVEVIFLPRHGKHHRIPPHRINYRANILGFKKLGVTRVISVSAVGGISKGLRPGDMVVQDQVLDMTRNRTSTFHEGDKGIVHIDFTEPYCPELRKILIDAGKTTGVSLKKRGTYVAVEGPRLETAAEIKSFAVLGGAIVGMTGMPEAALAREAEICFAGLSVVANYAAGISKRKLTVSEVMDGMKAATDRIRTLLKTVLRSIPAERGCTCGEALRDAMI